MSVKVTIADCRAGDEPKMFGKEGGGRVGRLSVASNDVVKDSAGKDVKETTWLPLVAYGPAARVLEANVHKGTALTVEGELRNRTFGEGDAKRTVSEIHVIPGRGKISLKDVAGERQSQASAPVHNQ
jgi:single-stranded DNA-binding protein